jgi:hypothetical protein
MDSFSITFDLMKEIETPADFETIGGAGNGYCVVT